MDIKAVIFDLDGTLVDSRAHVFGDVVAILEDLRQRGVKIALASYNAIAPVVLEWNSISKYFDEVKYDDTRGSPFEQLLFLHDKKQTMIASILSKFSVQPHECVLFDDQKAITESSLALGVHACLVDSKVGVTKRQVDAFLCKQHDVPQEEIAQIDAYERWLHK